MAQHHDQAVVMTSVVRNNPSPVIRSLADAIEQSQLVEIGEMRGWLLQWNQPLLPAGKPMTWMVADSKNMSSMAMLGPGDTMPGMATAADLNRLRTATGDAQATTFLQLMLRHHLSAVIMARYASQHATNRLVAQTATMMLREQSQEAATMHALLQQKGIQPLPFPDTPLELQE